MASARRGLTNGLGASSSSPFPAPRGRVNGLRRGATNGMRADGRVNGLRTAQGRVNGLVNGNGHVNGLGALARKGLVNGGGLVNGSGFTNGLSLRRNAFGIVTHRDLRRGGAILAASLLLMVVLGYLLSVPPEAPPLIAVDGNLEDWTSVVRYEDPEDAGPAHLDLREYAVHMTADGLLVSGRARGPLFEGSEPASVYVILNRGNDPAYAAPGLGAHAIAELWGWDGALHGMSLRGWTGSPDVDNATAFRHLGPLRAAVNGTDFELAIDDVKFELPRAPGALRILVAIGSARGLDAGAIIGPVPGALLVHQEPMRTALSGEQPVLRLTMYALGADVRVSGLTVVQSGGGTLRLPLFPLAIPAGTEHMETIALDVTGTDSGSFLTVRVTGVDAFVRASGADVPAPTTLSGHPARVYVDARPAGKAIDGLFDDWTGGVTTPDPDDDVPASVDLLETATAIQGGVFFYVRTQGDVLGGALLPERRVRVEPGGGPASTGPPVPLRRQAGEDILRIYVDTDDRDPVGEPFGGTVADRLLEVRGRLGHVTSRALFAWDSAASRWSPRQEVFDVEFTGSEFEGSAPATFFGAMHNPLVAFAMSDWSGVVADVSDIAGLRGASGSPGVRPWHGMNAQTIQATALESVPVVDGNCATTGSEYNGASTGNAPGLTFRVGRQSGPQHVFVCVEVTGDGTDNPGDWGELVFDTGHDGGTAPQADDRRFRVYTGSSVLISEKGNGAMWVSCGSDCDASDSATGAFRTDRQVYEFRIRFSDVWGTNSPSPNQIAGFAVVAYDAGSSTTYAWGSDAVSDTNPNTWGHIQIPEFAPLATTAGAALLVLLIRRRQSLYRAPRMRRR